MLSTDYTVMEFVFDLAAAVGIGLFFIMVMVSSAWVTSRFMRGSRRD